MKRGHRWTCPRCGSGVLAPSRPRRDDVRRFCLPCSAKTGRLVARTCPAREKRAAQREAAREAAAERRRERRGVAQDRAEERTAAYLASYPGCLHEYAKRWARLEAWEGADLSNVAIQIRQGAKSYVTGRAWISGYHAPSLCVTVGVAPEGHGYEVLLHELAHHAGARRPGTARLRGHEPGYWRLLARAVEEVLGHPVVWPPGPINRGVNKYAKELFQAAVDAGRLPGRRTT